MTKEFLPYEQALALKELVFDEPCFSVYYNGEYHEHGIQNQFLHEKNECSAPLYQQAFRWFRENHKLHSNIKCVDTVTNKHFRYEIEYNGDTLVCRNRIESHKEAELECLKKLIEIVKN